ncbi:MAG: ATP-binding protein [Bacilli bacterium]
MTFEELFPDATLESFDVEFKGFLGSGPDEKGLSSEVGWLKTLVAFANGAGGSLFVGVENKTHKIVALDLNSADKQIQLVYRTCKQRTDPFIEPLISKIDIPFPNETRVVIRIEIKPSSLLPVLLKDRGGSFALVRRFGQTDLATSEELRELAQKSSDISFDEYPTKELFNNNDFTSFFKSYQEHNGSPLDPKYLISKGFMDINGYLSRGALLFKDECKDPKTMISIVKYPGIDKGSSELLYVEKLIGPIHTLILKAANIIQAQSVNGIKKTSSGEKKIFSFPASSLLEGIANAFAHRNYWIGGSQIQISLFKDRVEIVSPGSLLGLQNLPKDKDIKNIKPRHRNEVICNALSLLGLIQGLGTGFDKIADDYRMADEAHQPYVESSPSSFSLTLPDLMYAQGVVGTDNPAPAIALIGAGQLSAKENQVLSFCYPRKRTLKEIAQFLGISVSSYLKGELLGGLITKGYLIQSDQRPASYLTSREKVYLI